MVNTKKLGEINMVHTIFIIPLLITFVGFLMYKNPPKKINWLIGYRTIKSMKNEKIWKKANQYCGKLWIKFGIIMLLVSSLLFSLIYFKILPLTETIIATIIFIQVAILVLSISIVENKIKKYK